MTSHERRDAIVDLLKDTLRTGRWIAAHLGISERTIYRDVAALKRAGLPIKGEPGVGYMLRPRVRQFQDWKRGL